MKKKTKNIIMIALIVVMCILLGLTITYATKNTKASFEQQNNLTPPTAPNNNQSGQNNTPPEKPNENSDNNTDEENPSNNNSMQPPENKDNNNQKNSNGMPPEIENNKSSEPSISTTYYIIFGIESFVLACLIIYLVMSKSNKKTLKETFYNTDKIMIGILCTILLTGGLTYTSSKITTSLINKTDKKSIKQNENSTATYSSVKALTNNENLTSGEYSSSKQDENVISASGSSITASIDVVTITKTGDSNTGDNTSFYGTNSAVIAKDGAKLTIKNAKIITNATGANGVFSYGGSATTNNSSSDGTTLTISDSTITTTKDSSGGIMTTGGGILNAKNLTINTSGTSSAAIRTDRGGGTVTVEEGTYTTTGKGSPAIYSTADVKVSNAKLVSKASEGIVIEGKNKVTLDSVELIDTNNTLNGQSTTYKNIFLYQSMSGDAANGKASFTSKNSKITTNKGDSFYVTNTTATITLDNNEIVNNDSEGNFLRVQKDSWGNSGSNGGVVTLNMTNQNAEGNIVIDSISTLSMILNENSYYEGTINNENTAKSIELSLDKTSKIKLTGNSYITTLNNEDTTNSNIDFNGYRLYVNGKAVN